MIYFFTPYSFEKKLFEAYDSYMRLIPNDEDWGCLMDGDMAFMLSDFGNQIQQYIDEFPDTDLFTCYASRCPYGHQMKEGLNPESDSIRYIFDNTVRMADGKLSAKVINQRIAGHLMVIRKSTWLKYSGQIGKHAENANIQAVDTAISDVILCNKGTIRLMETIQVFHYYRQYSFSEKHILSDKLTVVIRTHDRPTMFKRAIDSVRNQTHKNIDIVVGVDTPGSYEYAEKENPTKIIKLEGRQRLSHTDFPANEYISKLIAHITDGYILVLDDDNFIADPEGVEKLFKQIDKEWCLYMIRYRYPDGRLFPNDKQFRTKTIENGGVDWASCVFHARFKSITVSKPLYNADYYFISALSAHVRTTKWIDLALVHTETPGNDGKTESELIHEKGSTDVVYVLGNGSSWANNEIRYSIRSFVKYFKDLRNVVIVGEKPDFLRGVIHIPCEDAKKVNKDARMAIKLAAACKDARVSENFIFCTDDTLLLNELTADDFCGWHDGPILYDVEQDIKDHKRTDDTASAAAPSDWFKYVYATGEELVKRGLPDNNYDRAHCPQPINKAEFLKVMNEWNMVDNRFTISNIYNNSSKLFKGRKGKNAKLYGPKDLYDIAKLAKCKDCLNYNDKALNIDFKQFLNQRFSDPSPFELFSTPSDRRTAVQQWFESGCDYDSGVRIFSHFAPRNGLLIRYFNTKRGTEIGERKLKNTLQLWLR